MVLKIAEKHNTAHRRIVALAVFLLCFFVYVLTLSNRFYGYEGATLYFFQDIFYLQSLSARTPAGLTAALGYLPSEIVNLIFVNPSDFALRDFIALHTLPLMTALICLVFYQIAIRMYRSVRTAAGATLLLAFTTMLLPYSKMGMELQHTLWTLMAFLMLIRWQRTEKAKNLVFSGLCAGMILLTKIYGFMVVGAFVLYIFFDSITNSERRRHVSGTLMRFLLPIVPLVILFLVQNWLRFGNWFIGTRYNINYEAKWIPFWQGLCGFLFSSGKSIFVYSPILVVSVFYLPSFLKRFGRLKLFYILIFGLGLLFHSSLWIWTDETWGSRKLHYLIPFAVLPLGLMIEGFRRLSLPSRIAIMLLVLLGVFVQLLGVSISYESQPCLLREYGISSLENIRYNPRLSHTAVNYSLLQSTIDKYLTGQTHYFVYKPTYFFTVLPQNPPKPMVFPLKKFSQFDLWFMDNRAPRGGNFYLSNGARIYLSILLLVIPLLFFGVYEFSRRCDGVSVRWTGTAGGWALIVLCVAGAALCLVYNRAYSKDYKTFSAATRDVYDIAIGDDVRDEFILGPGWRGSEWMGDPKDPDYEIPFRWTNAPKSYLYFPSKPHSSYKLTLYIQWYYNTRLTVLVNGKRVGFVKGKRYDNKTPTFYVPDTVVGSASVCDVIIQNHKLHIPALEEPEKSKDTSTLGVMIYGVRWERMERGKKKT